MKEWAYFDKDGTGIFISFKTKWEAERWVKENEKFIKNPKSLYCGGKLKQWEYESYSEKMEREKKEFGDRIDRCRHYLMSVDANEINAKDALMALGFTSSGLDEL